MEQLQNLRLFLTVMDVKKIMEGFSLLVPIAGLESVLSIKT
jgi:hypothetical protein